MDAEMLGSCPETYNEPEFKQVISYQQVPGIARTLVRKYERFRIELSKIEIKKKYLEICVQNEIFPLLQKVKKFKIDTHIDESSGNNKMDDNLSQLDNTEIAQENIKMMGNEIKTIVQECDLIWKEITAAYDYETCKIALTLVSNAVDVVNRSEAEYLSKMLEHHRCSENLYLEPTIKHIDDLETKLPRQDTKKDQFWRSISVFISKPHIINRRVCGSKDNWMGLKTNENEVPSTIDDIVKSCIELPCLQQTIHSGTSDPSIEDIIPAHLKTFGYEEKSLNANGINDRKSFTQVFEELVLTEIGSLVLLRTILPKNIEYFQNVYEIIIVDAEKGIVYFITETSLKPSVLPDINFGLKFNGENMDLIYPTQGAGKEVETASSRNYLTQIVLTKLRKWASNFTVHNKQSDCDTLSLVDMNEYNSHYQILKQKYGKSLVEMWPETTDPYKYVYEDLGIACYILLIWDKQYKEKKLTRKQSFVDLGCGNGLLVYVLTMEGHQGIGIDLKRRKIWDHYPSHIKLEEGVVQPSDRHLMPQYDWLIGNHSDELTPWLPVIAAKSSSTCSFFVIPCCPYDFQNKYHRSGSFKSTYTDYIDYVVQIGTTCGFKMQRDRLKIPSTKRICLYGSKRTYEPDNFALINQNIINFIDKNCKRYQAGYSNTSNEVWASNFQHRVKDQPVRNCTRIPLTIKENIVTFIAKLILREENITKIHVDDGESIDFNVGVVVSISNIALELTADYLQALRNECGGLQTFLKNYKNVFNVYKGGVNLQIPKKAHGGESSVPMFQTKPCWFQFNHPQKCLWSDVDCAYSHKTS